MGACASTKDDDASERGESWREAEDTGYTRRSEQGRNTGSCGLSEDVDTGLPSNSLLTSSEAHLTAATSVGTGSSSRSRPTAAPPQKVTPAVRSPVCRRDPPPKRSKVLFSTSFREPRFSFF
ncbi:hypothetical protein DIPPA_33943 [Diplonema papillatum]|nr:hypothetical protein DIPPA_33943 [Diplonema papillatum]